MRSKISNAIEDISNEKLNRIKELSLKHPGLKSKAKLVREKAHEFNIRYYRPDENDNIHDLYKEVIDFQSSLTNLFEDEFEKPKVKKKSFKMVIASSIPAIKVKLKNKL